MGDKTHTVLFQFHWHGSSGFTLPSNVYLSESQVVITSVIWQAHGGAQVRTSHFEERIKKKSLDDDVVAFPYNCYCGKETYRMGNYGRT